MNENKMKAVAKKQLAAVEISKKRRKQMKNYA